MFSIRNDITVTKISLKFVFFNKVGLCWLQFGSTFITGADQGSPTVSSKQSIMGRELTVVLMPCGLCSENKDI